MKTTTGRSVAGILCRAVALVFAVGTLVCALCLMALPLRAENVELVGHIGGVCEAVAVQGIYAYVGEGPRLTILDISDAAHPHKVGSVLLPDIVLDVAVSGGFAYVANGESGLQIVNVSNPSAPVLRGSYVELGYLNPTYARGVTVSGGSAYVAYGNLGLHIVDVTNPSAPVLRGVYSIDSAEDVLVSGGVAFVAGAEIEGYLPTIHAYLFIIDVSNPSVPVLLGSYRGSSGSVGWVLCVAMSGNLVYMADWWDGFQIVDVSDPAAPFLRGACSTLRPHGVAVSGGLAYLANGSSGLQIVDVSNPSEPTLRGSYDTGEAESVAISGGLAYVADSDSGLQIVDVSNPTSPCLCGSYDTPSYAGGVAVSSGLAYVADYRRGLQIVDVSNPSVPVLCGSYDTPDYAYGVAVSGNRAYVADDESGLQIVDVANPSAPVLRGSCDTPGYACDVAVSGNLGYVADWSSGLQIVDVTNPSAPLLCGSYDTAGDACDIAVSGDLAYVADDYSGTPETGSLQIVDVTTPSAPFLRGSYDTLTEGVTISGGTAYVADWSSGLQIVDVSNPSAPFLRGSCDTPGDATDVGVSGGLAYVADLSGGLQIVDVSNPTSPCLCGSYDTPSYAGGVAVSSGLAYVADGAGGLFILRYTGPGAPGRLSVSPWALYRAAQLKATVGCRVYDAVSPNIEITAGNVSYELRDTSGTLRASGALSYVAGDGWRAEKVFDTPGLAPGAYTVRIDATAPDGRFGMAQCPLEVSGGKVTIRGTIRSAADDSPLQGTQVALFDGAAFWDLVRHNSWTVPDMSDLTAQLPPVRSSVTGSGGAYSWGNVSAGGTYVVAAQKSSYRIAHTGPAFPGSLSESPIVRDLSLTPNSESTLLGIKDSVGRVYQAGLDLLDRNAEFLAQVADRAHTDEMLDTSAFVANLNKAAAVFGILRSAAGAWMDYREFAGLSNAIGGVPQETFCASVGYVWADKLWEIDRALVTGVLLPMVQSDLETGDVPRTKSQVLNSDYTIPFRNLLDTRREEFMSNAPSVTLATGFDREKCLDMANRLSRGLALTSSLPATRLFPPASQDGVEALTLHSLKDAYAALSERSRLETYGEGALSGVEIYGSTIVLASFAAGWVPVAAVVAVAARGIGLVKWVVQVDQSTTQDEMAKTYVHALSAFFGDNATATRLFDHSLDFFQAEAASPYYVDKNNEFAGTVGVSTDLLLDSIMFTWPMVDTGFGKAFVFLRNTGNATSDFRCAVSSLYSLQGRANPSQPELGSISESFATGKAESLAPDGTTSLTVPFLGHGENLRGFLFEHYLLAETYSGPWQIDRTVHPYRVFPLGEIALPGVGSEWLATQAAEKGVASSVATAWNGRLARRETVMACAADAKGRIGVARLMANALNARTLVEGILNATSPTLTASFTAGAGLYAADVRLFAPPEDQVSILARNPSGRRLGYSAAKGIAYNELLGSVTNMDQRPISLRLLAPTSGTLYTVEVALLSPGPRDVPVSLFYEAVPRAGATMTAFPSPVVLDGGRGTTQTALVSVAEASGQQALTDVTAQLGPLTLWGGGAALVPEGESAQALGVVPAGEQRYVSWDVPYGATTRYGKYVGVATLSSAETADLAVPVVALMRASNETVGVYEGPTTETATMQKTLTIGAGGTVETWVHVPAGFRVVYAALGVVGASANLMNPSLDIGADSSAEWAFSGRFDLGVLVDHVEGAVNSYLRAHTAGEDGWDVPIRVSGPPGEKVLLNGIQLYLDAPPPTAASAWMLY